MVCVSSEGQAKGEQLGLGKKLLLFLWIFSKHSRCLAEEGAGSEGDSAEAQPYGRMLDTS